MNLIQKVKHYLYRAYWKLGNEIIPWNRVVLNQETRKLISQIQPEKLNVFEISGTDWKDFGFLSYKSSSMTDYDVCHSTLNETFDLIIAEQVFEHLLYPYRAGVNIYKMLNDGGYFLITTPFLYGIHNCPVDCTRWSETGLKYFLVECGFPIENISTGSWGNKQFLKSHANGNFCEFYFKYWHSLENDPNFPTVVWGLARK